MPELFTAWGTLAISTRGMKGDITRALQQAERSAKLNPKVDTSKLGAQGSRAGKEFGDRFSGAAKTAMATLAAATIGAGIVDQFRQVMSVGMDWTTNMNTLQAVTGATAEQLKAAGDAARSLGNDITIPATSANDAASAMTELAKGGFNVQQSMDAAQGSLRLAAAAQISATEAATIQSQALQAFGLDATAATKMSDTLANAANASSAEIVDVAAALQQAGTVANQFGLSAEDTAAAIGLLANNGIQGSDAGTLLKSSLLALTDQGKPAREAIRELGLTVYDAQGRFVGLHELFSQLGEASARMTPEAYQAATATLFGSDAMRLAGVAAKDGSASYDQMRVAIDRQGAAADVAAAKTRGLPGAWERVKNSIEALQLSAYDNIEGPVTSLLDGMSSGLGSLETKAADAWRELAVNPTIRGTWNDMTSAFSLLGAAAIDAWPAVRDIGISLAKASAAVGAGTWQLFVVALEAAAGVLQMAAPLLGTIADLMQSHQSLVTAAAAAWLLFKTVPNLLGGIRSAAGPTGTAVSNLAQQFQTARGGVTNFSTSYRDSVRWMQQANPTLSTANAHFRTMGSVAGAAASGGMTAMKTAAGGLMGALGGPWGLAITGATALIGALAQSHAHAAQEAANLRQRELELQGTLDQDTAKLTEETRKKVAERFDDAAAYRGNSIFQRGQGFGLSGEQLVSASTGDASAYEAIRAQGDAQILAAIDSNRQASGMAGDLERIGVGRQELIDALAKEGAGWDIVNQKIDTYNDRQLALGDAGAPILSNLDSLIQSLPDTAESWTVLTQAINEERRELTSATEALNRKNEAVQGTWEPTQEAADRFRALGAAIIDVPNDKTIILDALTQGAQTKVEGLGYTVTHMKDGTVKVLASTTEAEERLRGLVTKIETTKPTVTVTIQEAFAARGVNTSTPAGQQQVRDEFRRAFGANANGNIVLSEAIVPMADGGFRQIRKPRFADIYAGRGAGTVFAEEETGGEAYIPLAVSKRRRSMRILGEVARLFGMNVMEDGGITMPSIEELKQFASGISGGGYVRGGGNGDTLSGTDCSGAQAAIANFITGGTGRFATGNQAAALLARGFQQGDPPPGVAAYWVGWKNGGPGGGHTAGTILDPEGGNVNVEMGGSSGGGAYGAGAAGASEFPNRAWIQLAGGEDPNSPNSFSGGGGGVMTRTQRRQLRDAEQKVDDRATAVESAKASLAELDTMENVTDKQRTDRLKRVERAEREHQDALDDLADKKAEIAEKVSEAGEKADGADGLGGMDGQSIGQGIFSGLLQSIGLDGSLFSNPFEWPNVKSAMALINWGGGLLRGGEETDTASGGDGGLIPGLSLPGITDLLKPIGAQALEPKQLPDAAHTGSGAAPGPTFQVTANGMDPKAVTDKQNATYNGYARKHLSSVRPG